MDKDAGRVLHTDNMKLRMLNKKVKADFLSVMKNNIEIQMNMVPTTMTYSTALKNYRNAVNLRYPDNGSKRTSRQIQSASGRGRGGRGGGRDSQGRGGNRGGGRSRGGRGNKRNDAWEVIGINGK